MHFQFEDMTCLILNSVDKILNNFPCKFNIPKIQALISGHFFYNGWQKLFLWCSSSVIQSMYHLHFFLNTMGFKIHCTKYIFSKFCCFPLYGHSILIPYLPLLYEIQNRWRPIVIKCQIIFQFLYLYLFTYLIFTYICTITWLYYEIVAYTKSGSTLPTTTEG